MVENNKILEVKDLQVHYAVCTGTIKGVDHVDLSVYKMRNWNKRSLFELTDPAA